MRSRLLTVVLTLALTVPLFAAPAGAQTQTRFPDVPSGNVHAPAIEALAQVGVAGGHTDGTYRPSNSVTRAQMATFLRRALQLDERRDHGFSDVGPDHAHGGSIGAISRTSPPITLGCAEGRYCPGQAVSREQMATFLKRALDLEDDTSQSFDDVSENSVHAPGIRAVAAAGITLGCAPGRFCPDEPIRRNQMASFLDRALGLDGPVPCADPNGAAGDQEVLGAAVPPEGGYLTTGALRAGDGLELFSNDQARSYSVRVRDGSITATTEMDTGTRTWATTELGGRVYAGQWGHAFGETNLWSFPAEDAPGARDAVAVASVPDGTGPNNSGGEFWTLTNDGEHLWAGTRAHNRGAFRTEIGLAPNEHVVHRIDPDSGEIAHVTFDMGDATPPIEAERPQADVKQLAWHDGTLYVGLGQQDGGARLFALTGVEGDDPDPEVEDITPDSIREARAVFSLEVEEGVVAVGTQTTGEDEPAHLLALDTDTHEVLADVELRGPDGGREARVDSVAVDGDRVLGGTLPSGSVHEITFDRADAGATAGSRRVPAPVEDSPTRYLEVDGGRIRGVAGTGVVWEMADDGSDVSRARIAEDPRVPLTPGRAHSLLTTDDHVVVGASNIVTARPLDDPMETTVIGVGGEVKALAAGGGRTYAAVYPGGELWELDLEAGEAEQVVDWDSEYGRPRDAVVRDNGEVLVVARNDGTNEGAMFVLNPRNGTSTIPIPIRDTQGRALQATSIAVDEDREAAYVGTHSRSAGDASGYVREVAVDGRSSWLTGWVTRPARLEVTSLDVIDGALVGTAHSNGTSHSWFEVDPDDGSLRRGGNRDHELRGHSGDGAVLGPVSIAAKGRALVAINRGDGSATTLLQHGAHGTWGGPYVDMDEDCRIYGIASRELLRLPYDATTRLNR